MKIKYTAPFYKSIILPATSNQNTDYHSAGIYFFKVINGNTNIVCEVCPKTHKVNFEHTSHSGVSVVDFEQVNTDWDILPAMHYSESELTISECYIGWHFTCSKKCHSKILES